MKTAVLICDAAAAAETIIETTVIRNGATGEVRVRAYAPAYGVRVILPLDTSRCDYNAHGEAARALARRLARDSSIPVYSRWRGHRMCAAGERFIWVSAD